MKNILFNPGPTNVSEVVRQGLMVGDTCHRESEFFEALMFINQKLVEILEVKDTHSAVLFGCSGTGCNEAIINSINGKILLLNNGKYSERLGDIAKRYNIPTTILNIPLYEQFDIDKIEQILKEDTEISHILLVHHETTTGVLAPLDEIGELSRKYNKLLVIDAISSLGGHPLDLEKQNVAFCTVSANKCIESFPGVSFVIARTEEIKKLKGKSKSYYFDLYEQWNKEQKGETPFTPPVQLVFALKEALIQLEREGIQNRIERYKRMNSRMKDGLSRLGFTILTLPESISSNIIISLETPAKMDYWEVHDLLKKRGITIYSSKEVLNKNQFRVATMGSMNDQDIDSFLHELSEIKMSLSF